MIALRCQCWGRSSEAAPNRKVEGYLLHENSAESSRWSMKARHFLLMEVKPPCNFH